MSANDTECSAYDITRYEIYKDGSNQCRHREYHKGYKHGYCDAGEDRYWNGWYSGIMFGTLASIFSGLIIATTTKKSRISLF